MPARHCRSGSRFEAAIIRESLAATGGSIVETLKLLGIPRKTLYDKMARHGDRSEEVSVRARRTGTSGL